MKKIAVNTFGCKLNQAETAQLVELLMNQGYEITAFDQPADIYLINTCTVTAKAESRGRQAIRKARRLAPGAKIIVTGCYAEVAAAELCKLDEVDVILGSDYKFQLIDFLDTLPTEKKPIVRTCGLKHHTDFHGPRAGFFLENTRAFLKIQDGCNAFCSYCIVPYARGRSRSGEMDEIVAQAKRLVTRGFREIVLTGVHIGLFGHDLRPQQSLTTLVERLIKIPEDFRIRLSSLEPMEVTDDLLEITAESDKVCPHFHVPLQNGDDVILKAMHRNYTAAQFEEIILKVNEKFPDAGLGTDVIVGFPGETGEHFENTLKLIERLPFTYLHVFTYSVRKGTAAAKLPNRIPKNIQMERSRRLRELATMKQRAFWESQIQKRHPVLFEEENNGWMSGFTSNYIRVKAPAEPALINTIQPVRLLKIDKESVSGRIETSKRV